MDPMARVEVSEKALEVVEPQIAEDRNLEENLKHKEFQIIIDELKNESGSRRRTAEKLGISARTLRYKLAKMRESGIDV